MREGPGVNCGVSAWSVDYSSTQFYPDCWVRNDAGNAWWHGIFYKPGGIRKEGWLWEGNVSAHLANQLTASHRCF